VVGGGRVLVEVLVGGGCIPVVVVAVGAPHRGICSQPQCGAPSPRQTDSARRRLRASSPVAAEEINGSEMWGKRETDLSCGRVGQWLVVVDAGA
jgi:hypothetical protein